MAKGSTIRRSSKRKSRALRFVETGRWRSWRALQMHPNMITKWKREALEGMKDRFARGGKTTRSDHQAELRNCERKSASW